MVLVTMFAGLGMIAEVRVTSTGCEAVSTTVDVVVSTDGRKLKSVLVTFPEYVTVNGLDAVTMDVVVTSM